MMLEAASHIDKKQQQKPSESALTSEKEKSLFIHLQFHPHDIDRRAIRQIYNETLQG
jgi:hypothetical protein